MKAYFISLLLFLCLPAAASAGSEEAFIEDAARKYGAARNYACIMEVYERSGDKDSTRILRYYFRKPATIRIEILEGKDSGGVALYKNNWVWGRQSGLFRGIRLKFRPTDRMVVSDRGSTMDQSGWGYLLAELSRKKEQGFTLRAEETEGMYPCRVISVSGPGGDTAVISEKFYIDGKTGAVIRHESYRDNALVSRSVFKDFVIDGSLDGSLFDEKKF